MAAAWQLVAFPLILSWREEFWTLPLYFPDLTVGVVQGWPAQLPYRGLALPPEAELRPHELKHYRPGDLRQWQAFDQYRQAGEAEGDLLNALRNYGQAAAPPQGPAPDSWTLAWQLEKMQADQEAQLVLVDKGQDWLGEILAPEPWEDRPRFGPVPGVGEMVDPDLARLRYLLWRRVMAPRLQEDWAPLLLGRTSKALFLTLRGWPEWAELREVGVSLPGCRSLAEWTKVEAELGGLQWQANFSELLAALLAAAESDDFAAPAAQLQEFVDSTLLSRWPSPQPWKWDLEVWAPAEGEDDLGPVLCWAGAGAGILPGV